MLYYDENVEKIVSSEQLQARGLQGFDDNALLALNIYRLVDDNAEHNNDYYFVEYGKCVKNSEDGTYTRQVSYCLKPVDIVKRVAIAQLSANDSLDRYGLTENTTKCSTTTSAIKTIFMAFVWSRDFAEGAPAVHRNMDNSWSTVPADTLATMYTSLSKICQFAYSEKASTLAAINDCRTSEEVIELLFTDTEENN